MADDDENNFSGLLLPVWNGVVDWNYFCWIINGDGQIDPSTVRIIYNQTSSNNFGGAICDDI